MRTMQQLIDFARRAINDDDKVRCSDPELLDYAIAGLLMVRARRPDLFLGRWTLPIVSLGMPDAFPLDETLFAPVADYVVSRSQFKDDEAAVQLTAKGFYDLFVEGL